MKPGTLSSWVGSFLRQVGFAAALGWGGSFILGAPSLMHVLAGVLLWGLALGRFSLLLKDVPPCLLLSRSPLRQERPSRCYSVLPRFLLVALSAGGVLLVDRGLRSGRWEWFLLGLFGTGAALVLLEKGSPAFQTDEKTDRLPGGPAVAPILLATVGGVFLLYRLPSWPNWLHNDGAMSLRAALQFLEGKFRTPFFTEWGDNPALPFLLYAGAFRLLGVELWTAALVPITAFGLALPLFYGFCRRLLAAGPALAAALLWVGSRWVIFYVRTPREVSLLPAFEAAALYFFAEALETGRIRHFLGFGLSLALCLHTYLASRAVLAFFLAFFLFFLFLKTHAALRQSRGWALGWGTFALAMLPLLDWYRNHPETLYLRIREINVFSAMERTGASGLLTANLLETLRMFHVSGMDDFHFNLAGVPILDPVSGLFLWAGLAWCLVRWNHWPALFLLLGFSGTLAATVLAVPPAHPMRAIANAPFAILLAVLGADRLFRAAAVVLPLRAVPAILWSLFLIIALAWNYDVYFRRMPQSRALWETCEGYHVLAARALRAYPAGWTLFAQEGYAEYNHERVFLHGRSPAVPLNPLRDLPLPETPGEGVVLLLEHSVGAAWGTWIQNRYPGSRSRTVRDPFHEAAFWILEIPAEKLAHGREKPPSPLPVRIRAEGEGGEWRSPALFALTLAVPRSLPAGGKFRLEAVVDPGERPLAIDVVGEAVVRAEGLPAREIRGTGTPFRLEFPPHWKGGRLVVEYRPPPNHYHVNLFWKDGGQWVPVPYEAYRSP